MNIIDLLVGKPIKVETNMNVEVEMTIKSINFKSHNTQITPDTPENDWWGETQTSHWYIVTFENGTTKKYNSLEEIKFEK